jgi:hypothetical protein
MCIFLFCMYMYYAFLLASSYLFKWRSIVGGIYGFRLTYPLYS